MGMEFGLNYNLIQSHSKLFLKHTLNHRQNIVQTISLYSLWSVYEVLGTVIPIICCAELLSRVWLSGTPWTAARQAPLSMGILQARILDWVSMPSSRGSSQPRDQTQVFHIAGRFFTFWAINTRTILQQNIQNTPDPIIIPILLIRRLRHTEVK